VGGEEGEGAEGRGAQLDTKLSGGLQSREPLFLKNESSELLIGASRVKQRVLETHHNIQRSVKRRSKRDH
jgi:hypothetical protein